MDQYRRMHARRLVARDPKFRKFLKDNPKIAAEVYKNTPNPPKNTILKVFFYGWHGIFQFFRLCSLFIDKLVELDKKWYGNKPIHEHDFDYIDKMRRETYTNPATGLSTSGYGSFDVGGYAWGSNHY